MSPDVYQKATAAGACVDLSDRSKWRLSGADRVRYLNGQVTNDVRHASATAALYACVTNAKGRIEGDVFIHGAPKGAALFIDAEPALREPLGLRLEKYIIADDAELTDVSDEWTLWHIFGDLAEGAWRLETEAAGGHVVESRRYAAPGIDLWLPVESPQARPLSALIHTTHVLLSAADAEDLRILLHVPRFPQELNGDAFPAEAGLETRAMSFAKGCYIGQEVLSRIKTTGKMPRVLVAWEAPAAETAVAAGDRLFTAAGDRPLGSVTSVARHPETGRLTGLAYVRQEAAAPHSVLLVGNDVPRIGVSVTTLSLVPP